MPAKHRRLRGWLRGGAPAMLGAALAVAACGGDSGGGDTVEPKLSAIESKIFARRCGFSVSCHASDSPNPREVMEGTTKRPTMGLDLVPPVADNILNKDSEEVPGRKLIVPGDPDASYLFEKISSAKPTYGERMPDMNGALDPGVIAGIREWIRAGAKPD